MGEFKTLCYIGQGRVQSSVLCSAMHPFTLGLWGVNANGQYAVKSLYKNVSCVKGFLKHSVISRERMALIVLTNRSV